ncbi:MAG: hypothetical protein LBD55_03555 [Treponema sp.]|jgi:hypothetical protein|nr:hypothetical protein [Treponema sp.]
MGILTEGNTWVESLTQLETSDPVLGGPNGPANTQAKELGSRTKYLKTITDEVVNARGGKANLDERLDRYDAFDPGSIAALYGFMALGIDLAGLANRENLKTIRQRIQAGIVTITNRGVISGCTVSKSASAIRNLSLSAGTVFMNGITIPVPAMANCAMVASNSGTAAQVCYGYLFLDAAGAVRFSVTDFGAVVPDSGIPLCRITVPAGNDQVSDPNLASVTITDVRRVEAGYPMQVNSIAYASVALSSAVGDGEYAVLLDILDAKGGWNQRETVYAGDKASNGFRVYSGGSLDAVKVRWAAIKPNL